MSVITRGASLLAGSALAVGAAVGMPALAAADDDYDASGTRVTEEISGEVDSTGTRVTDEGSGDIEAQAVYRTTWRNAPSYGTAMGLFGGSQKGTLYTGSNYFYCQKQSAVTTTVTDSSGNRYHNNWWLRTDDDSGNKNVWVNAVFVSGGYNDTAVAGVPHC